MGKTTIEWLRGPGGSEGFSWNALRARRKVGGRPGITANHCEHVNEACRFCYAETLNARLGGLPFKPGHRNDYEFFVDEKKLTAPLRMRKPTIIFVESMSDAFGDWWPDSFVDQLYAVMALTPQHTYVNLSKRPERRRRYLDRDQDQGGDGNGVSSHMVRLLAGSSPARKIPIPLTVQWPLPNVIEGTSVSCQEEADEFVPILLNTKCAQTVVSAEPLLGPIDFVGGGRQWLRAAAQGLRYSRQGLGGIFVGGESGPRARPMHPQWARDIRDQFDAAGVPFHYKQTGAWVPIEGRPRMVRQGDCFLAPDGRSTILGPDLCSELEGIATPLRRVGKAAAGRLLDGVEHNGFPEIAR